MIDTLPDLALLKIVEFLKLPDIENLIKCYPDITNKIQKYKKKFNFFDKKTEENNIFIFNLKYLLDNKKRLMNEIMLNRNTFLIDYTYQSYNHICYIDSRGWFILEYYLNFFDGNIDYEMPDFYEKDFFEDKNNFFGVVENDSPKLLRKNVKINDKIGDYIFFRNGFKSNIFFNNFDTLYKIL